MAHFPQPADLEAAFPLLANHDLRLRQQLGDQLVRLVRREPRLDHDLVAQLVERLQPFFTSGNFKIAQNGLEVIAALAERMGHDFAPFVPAVLPAVIDRLADSKESVRHAARATLCALAERRACSPRAVLARLAAPLAHKAAPAREEAVACVADLLAAHGAGELQLKALVPTIAALAADPSAGVRDAALQLLVDLYRHVGDRLRTDLRKKELIPPAKFALLEQRFDEVQRDGLLLPSASQGCDEADFVSRTLKRALTLPTAAKSRQDPDSGASTPAGEVPKKSLPGLYGMPAASRKPPPPVKLASSGSVSSSTGHLAAAGGEAGAVSVESFEAAIATQAASTVYGARGLDDVLRVAAAAIGDRNADWEKRVDALRKVRALLAAGAHDQYPAEFAAHLRELSVPFLVVVKDLRSQVVREACLTIAHMSQVLRGKLEQFAVYVMQELVNLIQNSAKVISSAGTVCVHYVVLHVHSPRLLPVVVNNMCAHKSKEIRSALSKVLLLVLEQWPLSSVERQQAAVRDAIRKGCADADAAARTHARRAFAEYSRLFPADAEALFQRLEPHTQKHIERERGAAFAQAPASTPRERRGITSPRSPLVSDRPAVGARSVSALDAAAAQRARARALYSTMQRANTGHTHSLPRSKRSPGGAAGGAMGGAGGAAGAGVPPSPERGARSRSRPRVSQSQPTSRSSSPSQVRLSGPLSLAPRRRPSGIPRSLATSRETSPTRTSRSNSLAGGARRPSVDRARAHHHARDSDSLLRSPDDHSLLDTARMRDDDSEASSVCSERSVDSYRRHDNSWSGSTSRLGYASPPPPPPPADILALCASVHWSERRDGLTHLANYLNSGRLLTEAQLSRATALLNKMFVDTHTKGFSLLLDAVGELLLVHAAQLRDWLFQLLLRLLTKLGTDILGSVQNKIMKTLDVIHECFPAELQLHNIFRFLADSATAPTVRTKVAALRFLTDLARDYCSPASLAAATQGEGRNACLTALGKMATHAHGAEPRAELRAAARAALAALLDCNPAAFTAAMGGLSADAQAHIGAVVQQHVRRSSAAGVESPARSPGGAAGGAGGAAGGPGGADDVYSRIRRTTTEIHTYTKQHSNATESVNHMSSKDSGISQMSDVTLSHRGVNGAPNGHCHASEAARAVSGDSSEDANSTKESSPTPRHAHHAHLGDYSAARDKAAYETDEDGYIITKCGLNETQVLEALCRLDAGREPPEEWERLLLATHEVIKYGDCRKPKEYFKNIVRVALAALSNDEAADKENSDAAAADQTGWATAADRAAAAAVRVLAWLCRRPESRDQWLEYFDLILLKMMHAYARQRKEVMRAVDAAAPHVARAVPAPHVIALVKPVIRTRGYPASLCALKLAAEVGKARAAELSDEALGSLMEGIAQLADHENSAVRKAAVFGMVAYTCALGEERMRPHLARLSVSKYRLLQVYIGKNKSEAGRAPAT